MKKPDRYPTIRQLPDGKYFTGQPRCKGERMASKVCDTRKECEQLIDAFYKECNEGKWVAPNRVLTFGELADNWIAGIIKDNVHRPGTIRPWQDQIVHLKAVLGENLKCDQLTFEKVREARRKLLLAIEEGGRGLTTTKAVTTLGRIFRHGMAIKAGVKENFVALLPRNKVSAGRKTDKKPVSTIREIEVDEALDPAEAKRLVLASQPGFFRLIISLMVYSGLRISEALALTWKHIDVKEGAIQVEQTLSTDKIKGVPDQPLFEYYDPKTDSGFRTTVILDDGLVQALRELKEKIQDENELVFHDENNQPILNRWSVNDHLKKILPKAKITKHIFPHLLRHTFASTLIDMNRPIAEISRYMGHSSPLITQSIYWKLIDRKTKKTSIRDQFKKYQAEFGD
jgi:integrase